MDFLNFHHLRYFWAVARESSVSRAAKLLRVSQPTVSEQIRLLEGSLGEALIERSGRGIVLTEMGRVAYRFADDIFALGAELTDTLKGRASGRPTRLTIGVLDAIPKMVALRILEPALAATFDLRVVCYEGKAERLLAQLAAHELDVVLADGPIGPSHDTRAHNHLLGESEVGVFGTEALVRQAKSHFPWSLAKMPFLLPTPDAPLRRALDGWLDEKGIVPNVIGEFQDAALLTTFGELGKGLFAAPDAVAESTLRARGLARAGLLEPLRERFYAVTVARKVEHPAVAAIVAAANTPGGLFPSQTRKPPSPERPPSPPPTAGRSRRARTRVS
jgi:LysR family transcriptional activator of nhaA